MPTSPEKLAVINPATAETIATVSLASPEDVAKTVEASAAAFPAWRETPAPDRIQYLFKFKQLLEQNYDEIARTITLENGKTLGEAKAELRRGIENVEVACGIPILMQGYNLEDVARGIDEIMIRQPIGVVAAITPFNFPAMIPLWFLPYAIACGNTFILKPSERVPLTARKLLDLLVATGLPENVVSLVTGAKPAVDALLRHPKVKAISFVGSTPVARYIYAEASAQGKRVQCQGGAKNHVVIMPDADMQTSAQIVSDSAFGCAGQRCLAVSVAITVGEAKEQFQAAIVNIASQLKIGSGLDESVQMGPVISLQSKQRIEALIQEGLSHGGKSLLNGSAPASDGYFLQPAILENIAPDNALTTTEIFGPVLTLSNADDLDGAIDTISRSSFGNAASIFTSNGAAARRFRYQVPTGNVGVNIGVAAPMAYFPFSGWRDSFLGVLHGQGRDAVEFYTDKKVVIERWPKEWSRKF